MGYKILYNPEMEEKYPGKKRRAVRKNLLIVTILAIAVFVFTTLGSERIADYFIPGDPDITQAAFETMVNELGNGETVKNAVAVFCREIITGAERNKT